MTAPDGPSRSPENAVNSLRQCVFCREDIRPGASVCPHCGGTLTPLQEFADRHAALERRLAALEEAVATQRAGGGEQTALAEAAAPSTDVGAPSLTAIKWPHMADNIFLGLVVLLAAHWLATTLPAGGRTWFRLVALVVALPFGFRFERHSQSGTSGQVLAALSFGCTGTLAIGVLDMALAGHGRLPVMAEDVIASVATIALSHFAGSASAHLWQVRGERAAGAAAATSSSGGATNPLRHIAPAQIKGTAEAIKALYDAAAPIAAGAAALWAAFGHMLF